VLESGVGCVAVVRAITQAADVPAAVDALQATFRQHVRA
jgi:thiamine-phosphate pyrophosphorylase